MAKQNKNIKGYPSPLATKKAKDKKSYGLQYFKKMFQDWDNEGINGVSGREKRFKHARAYSSGTQSIHKYKSQLNNSGDETYMNLDWNVVSVIPKFVDVVVNGLAEQEYEMNVSAIDSVSVNKKIKDRDKFFVNMLNKDFNEEFSKISGMPNPESGFTPDSSDELDLYMNLSYKQKNEIAMEQALKGIKELNDYEEIRKKTLRDLTICGMAVSKTETHKSKGVRINYVDPANFIHSHIGMPDARNLFHAGEVKYMTIGEIRQMMSPGELTEKELHNIAESYTGKLGNAFSASTSSMFNPELGYEEYDYDSFKVRVLDGCFKSDYSIIYEKKENKYGYNNLYRKDENYKKPSRSKYDRELIKQPATVYYTGLYIIGTDYLINYGVAENMVRKKSTLDQTPCPYIVYIPNVNNSNGKSLVERMIPFADQIQLAHLKLQLLVAKARPKGAAFELGALENVSKGDGASFTPLQLQDIYDQTGNIYYRRQDDEGNLTSALPIQELENGIGRDMQSLIALYNHNMQLIRDVTGINEARDATQPSNKALIGTQKLALMASNNATKHINNGELSITKRIAEHSILRLQDIIKYSNLKNKYLGMLGEAVIESIKIGADFHLNEFGLSINMAPDEAERQMFEQNIQMSLQQKELRLEDAIFIRSIKNIKLANQSLIIRRKKYQKDQQQLAQQQQEKAMQLQQQKAQSEMQKMQQEKEMEFTMKSEFEKMKHEQEMERLQKEYELKLQLKQVENDGLANKEKIKTDGSKEVQDKVNQGKSDLQQSQPSVEMPISPVQPPISDMEIEQNYNPEAASPSENIEIL